MRKIYSIIFVVLLLSLASAAEFKKNGNTVFTIDNDINTIGDMYFGGNMDGNLKFSIDNYTGYAEIKELNNLIWQPSSLELDAETLFLGKGISLSAMGNYLSIGAKAEDVEYAKKLFSHSLVSNGTTVHDAQILYLYDYQERVIIQPDDTGEWIGTVFESIVVSPDSLMTNKFYLKIGSIAPTKDIKYSVFHGTDNTGELIFDKTYSANSFSANAEVSFDFGGELQYNSGETYFAVFSSDETFSLKTNAAGDARWFAADFSLIREDLLLQTKDWFNNTSYPIGDYIIKNRKIYVSSDNSIQIGSFESNLDKWDTLLSGYQDRIVSDDGLKNLIISNDSLIYNDGARDFLNIDNGGLTLNTSNGYYLTYSNVGKFRLSNGENDLVVFGGSTYNQINSPNRNWQFLIGNGEAKFYDKVNNVDRIIATNTNSGFYAPNGYGYTLGDNSSVFRQNGKIRSWITDAFYMLFSNSLNSSISLGDGWFTHINNGVIRLGSDSNSTYFQSQNENHSILTNNSGTYVIGNFTVGDGQIEIDEDIFILQSTSLNHNLLIGNDAITYDGGELFTSLNTLSQVRDVSPSSLDNQILVWNATSNNWDSRNQWSGNGSGDVIGSSSSIDMRIARFDGISGKIIQNSVVTLSDNGIVLGVTQMAVDNVLLDGDNIKPLMINTDLNILSEGTGNVLINGIVFNPTQSISNATSLEVGDLFMYRDTIEAVGTNTNIELSPTGIGQVIVNSVLNANAGAMYYTSENGKFIQLSFKKDGTRTSVTGYSSSGNYDYVIKNEVAGGNIAFKPDDDSGNGIIYMNGYTRLGQSAPAIKYKKLTGTMPVTEGGSMNIAHGLTGSKILSVDVLVAHSGAAGNRMPPGYVRNAEYEYYVWTSATNVNIALSPTNSGFIVGDAFTILITYEA